VNYGFLLYLLTLTLLLPFAIETILLSSYSRNILEAMGQHFSHNCWLVMNLTILNSPFGQEVMIPLVSSSCAPGGDGRQRVWFRVLRRRVHTPSEFAGFLTSAGSKDANDLDLS
jgi:hypothetical protein